MVTEFLKAFNSTKTTTKPQIHLPTPFSRQGVPNVKHGLGTIKYHWIKVQ
jgi:hypothetical protein